MIVAWADIIRSHFLSSYGLYSISCATFVCYIYSISLSIKLRDFDLTDMQKYIADYKMADKVSKAGMSLEVVMVCTVSKRTWVTDMRFNSDHFAELTYGYQTTDLDFAFRSPVWLSSKRNVGHKEVSNEFHTPSL